MKPSGSMTATAMSDVTRLVLMPFMSDGVGEDRAEIVEGEGVDVDRPRPEWGESDDDEAEDRQHRRGEAVGDEDEAASFELLSTCLNALPPCVTKRDCSPSRSLLRRITMIPKTRSGEPYAAATSYWGGTSWVERNMSVVRTEMFLLAPRMSGPVN